METGLLAVNHWSFIQKLLFRFWACYFFIYIFPFPLGYVPFTDIVNTWVGDVWDPLVYWAGKNILHIPYTIDVKPNGSGDTTYNYVQLFLMAVFAVIAAVIWSAMDRRRKSYDLLLYWVVVLVRYYLAFSMMGYGLYKVIKTQFPFPYYHLTETYAESSPMGLLWNFMGYSTAFNMFTGAAEILGGFLLLFRKTTLFGSLVLMTVLSNIVAMNFCFDVPVKLYSSNLLLMAIFIAVPDMRRLIDFFFRNKAVPSVKIVPKFNKRWMKITWLTVKVLLIGTVVYTTVTSVWSGYKEYGDEAIPKSPMFGIYNVEIFVKNNDTLPPLTTDTTRWKQLSVSFPSRAFVRIMNDSARNYNLATDTVKKTVDFTSGKDSTYKSHFKFYQTDSLHIAFTGVMQKDSVYMLMRKIDPRKSLLVSRGFHWINEYPFNR